MMWLSIALATPLRRRAPAVCIDLISPWVAESRFNAPTPMTSSPSQTDQTWMSGARNPLRSSACALPGAVCARAVVRWWASSACTRGSSSPPSAILIDASLSASLLALSTFETQRQRPLTSGLGRASRRLGGAGHPLAGRGRNPPHDVRDALAHLRRKGGEQLGTLGDAVGADPVVQAASGRGDVEQDRPGVDRVRGLANVALAAE